MNSTTMYLKSPQNGNLSTSFQMIVLVFCLLLLQNARDTKKAVKTAFDLNYISLFSTIRIQRKKR